MDLIRRQFAGFGGWKFPLEPNDTVYLPVDSLRACSGRGRWSDSRIEKVIRRSEHVVAKLHWSDPDLSEVADAQPRIAEWLRHSAKVIYVVRNPKAVLQSLWNWEIAAGKVSRAGSPSLSWLQERLKPWAQHVDRWTAREGIQILRFEDIVENPRHSVDELGAFLGVDASYLKPLLPPRLKGVWHSRFNRLFSITPSSTEIVTTRIQARLRWGEAELDLVRECCGQQLTKFQYE
jgi:hypothetical protein